MSDLQQLNIQFRTKEPFTGVAAKKLRENLATVLVGAAAEAGISVVMDGGPLNVTNHVHDAQSSNACVGCINLAQDGRA